MFPFGARRLVGFVGDHHEQHIGPHVAAGFSAACIMRAAVGAKAVGVLTPLPKQSCSPHAGGEAIPASLCPAQITFIGCDGRGLTRQSFMVK